MIKCKLCGIEFHSFISLSNHIKKHKIKSKDYYDKYLKKENDGICICGSETKFYNLELGYHEYCSAKCLSNDPKVKDKKRKTCINKYGTDSPLKNFEINIKKQQTCLKRYGVKNPSQLENIKNQKMITCLKHYGVSNPSKSKKIQKRKEITSYKRYSTKNPYQNQKIQNKYKQTCIKRYGVDHYTKTKKWKRIFREKFIRRIENQKLNGLPFQVSIGKNETACLDILQNFCKFSIKRNNEIIGYFPDGYIKELNVIIEFDEPFHKQKWCIDKDINRQKELENFLECSFFRIDENVWIKTPKKIILDFIKFQLFKRILND